MSNETGSLTDCPKGYERKAPCLWKGAVTLGSAALLCLSLGSPLEAKSNTPHLSALSEAMSIIEYLILSEGGKKQIKRHNISLNLYSFESSELSKYENRIVCSKEMIVNGNYQCHSILYKSEYIGDRENGMRVGTIVRLGYGASSRLCEAMNIFITNRENIVEFLETKTDYFHLHSTQLRVYKKDFDGKFFENVDFSVSSNCKEMTVKWK